MTAHEIEYDEEAADRGVDRYTCSCGETFAANGDIVAAFEHGFDAGADLGAHE